MKENAEQKVRIELIEEYRKKNNLSKKEFCSQCGITLKAFQKINYKKNKYQTDAISKIAKATRIEICDLYLNE